MQEFVGFCFKWLHLEPSMKWVMHPQVVAKYFGFHVAKGTSIDTMHNIATHIYQVVEFVTSSGWPSHHHWGQSHIDATLGWLSNLKGKTIPTIKKHYQAKEEGITLWKVWEATLAKWDKLQAKLHVSGWWCLGLGAWQLCWVCKPGSFM